MRLRRAAHAELLTRLPEAWTAIMSQHPHSLMLGLNEIDPTSIMEVGLIMPPLPSGEEAAWLDRHKQELGEVLSSR